MRTLNRYWMFFLFIAIGLAVSWGQIGRKTHDALRDRQVDFLATEQDCRPLLSPCAAMGGDQALVLGPGGPGVFVLKSLGIAGSGTATLKVTLLRNGVELAKAVWRRRSDASWEIGPLPDVLFDVLRVNVSEGGRARVADFPLQPAP